jgi:hypothetical protein
LNFVLNGGPAGTQWDKEGKGDTLVGGAGCSDYAVAFPLSGPITSIPNSYLLARGKMIKEVAPNPAVGNTNIKYFVAKQGKVTVKVYNSLGTEVSTILNEDQSAGEHQFNWETKVPTGIYHVSVSANGITDAAKIVVK